MKKKDIIEGRIERIDFPNIGIINYDDKDVRVKNALPGQFLCVQIQKTLKSKIEAKTLEILEKSPLENEPDVCEHFGICGGCLYSSIPYPKEIKIKEEQVRRLIAPVIGEDAYNLIYDGISESPIEKGYRSKMEFSFGDEYKGGPLALGMHKRGAFYDIVTVKGCQIADVDYSDILLATLEYFGSKGISFYNKSTHEGLLRHLLIRKAAFSGEILVDLVTASGMATAVINEWAKKIINLSLAGRIVGILHTNNDRISDVIEDQGTDIIFGTDFFTENLLGYSFKITPFSFFQTNSYSAEILYSTIRKLIPKSGIIYDLYCGTGTIGQIVSESAEQVIGVEIVKEAVKAAKENTRINRIDNAEFLAGDVLKVLDELSTPPDMIILDPPREGVNPKALKKILSYKSKEIIYVSCKPTSLVRDMKTILDYGYNPDYIKLVDMFPRTGNIETVCRFVLD